MQKSRRAAGKAIFGRSLQSMQEDCQFVRTTANPAQIEKIAIMQLKALWLVRDSELSWQQNWQNRLQMPVTKEKRRTKQRGYNGHALAADKFGGECFKPFSRPSRRGRPYHITT